MGGLLVGILAGRVIAGFVGGSFGWRTVYWMSAVVALIMAWLIRRELPECHSAESGMSYMRLLASALGLFRHRQMREWAFVGAMTFGAFNVFWTTLVFLLERPPYHYGARMAGALGLLAVASAGAAPLMGKIVDKRSARFGVGWSLIFLLASFVVLYLVGFHLWGLALLESYCWTSLRNLRTPLTSHACMAPSLRNAAGRGWHTWSASFSGRCTRFQLGGWGWTTMVGPGVVCHRSGHGPCESDTCISNPMRNATSSCSRELCHHRYE